MAEGAKPHRSDERQPASRDPRQEAAISTASRTAGGFAMTHARVQDPEPPRDLARFLRDAAAALEAEDGETAAAAAQKALALAPNAPDALWLDGVAKYMNGDRIGAKRALEAALAIRPDHAGNREALGDVLASLEDKQGALEAYRAALALEPERFSALLRAAGACLNVSAIAEADDYARRALAIRPEDPTANVRFAVACVGFGRFDEAEIALAKAGVAGDAAVEAWTNFGRGYLRFDGDVRAERAFRRALELAPDHGPALTGLGATLMVMGRVAEAKSLLRRAIAIEGTASEAASVLGNLLVFVGDTAPGLDLMRAAAEREAAAPREVSSYLANLSYSDAWSPEAILKEHKRFDARFAAPLAPAEPAPLRAPDPERPLSIGVVSADFRAHAVSYFSRPLFGALHARGVDLVAYANVGKPDYVTDEMKAVFGRWRDIPPMTDEAVAAKIRDDRIDVLIDLGGHTAGARPLIFAHRAAPLQLSYLGYPATTGMAAVDARIVDWVSDPEGFDAHASERLLRLDRCFLSFRAEAYPSITPPPSSLGAPPTFGSFNKFAKITDAVLDLWAELLRACPEARLVLKDHASKDDINRARLRDGFVARGVAAERVVFLERASGLVEHLECYGMIDVALDPFPYGGTTTTCEALWMGVPVVTIAGDRHAARVSASILDAIGLDAAVAADAAEFVLTARELIRAPELLAALRVVSREDIVNSPLGDADGLAAAFDEALRGLWRERCLAARSDAAPAYRGAEAR